MPTPRLSRSTDKSMWAAQEYPADGAYLLALPNSVNCRRGCLANDIGSSCKNGFNLAHRNINNILRLQLERRILPLHNFFIFDLYILQCPIGLLSDNSYAADLCLHQRSLCQRYRLRYIERA